MLCLMLLRGVPIKSGRRRNLLIIIFINWFKSQWPIADSKPNFYGFRAIYLTAFFKIGIFILTL